MTTEFKAWRRERKEVLIKKKKKEGEEGKTHKAFIHTLHRKVKYGRKGNKMR